MTITDFQFWKCRCGCSIPACAADCKKGGKAVFKRYSQAKLNMTREALAKLGSNQ